MAAAESCAYVAAHQRDVVPCARWCVQSVVRLLILTLAIFVGGSAVWSQEGAPAAKPEYKAMHAEQDWAYFCEDGRKTEWADQLKCIKLDKLGHTTLSVGGLVRERGEYFDHPAWGQDPPDNGYSLERYMLYGDLRSGDRFRAFAEFESGLEFGRDGGPRPVIDRDELFLHQAFIDLTLYKDGPTRVLIRTGRQELSFGADRLVAIREGPNNRQSFDGFRLTVDHGDWKVDALAMKFSETNPGVLDDPPNHDYSFWGLYGVRPLVFRRKAKWDLYYFGIDKKVSKFDQGAGREQRHTVGSRVSEKIGGWDYDYEGIYQFGRFGAGDIRAWAVATNTGYTFSELSWRPRIGLDTGVASGDGNPHDGTLGTFNALFPKGAYFSEAELIGPYNVVVARPSIRLELSKKLTVTPDAEFLWRESTEDGIYAVPGVLVRSGRGSDARYIGGQANVELEWRPNRHWQFNLIYLHFFPGQFLKQTHPARDVNFVAPWITYNF